MKPNETRRVRFKREIICKYFVYAGMAVLGVVKL